MRHVPMPVANYPLPRLAPSRPRKRPRCAQGVSRGPARNSACSSPAAAVTLFRLFGKILLSFLLFPLLLLPLVMAAAGRTAIYLHYCPSHYAPVDMPFAALSSSFHYTEIHKLCAILKSALTRRQGKLSTKNLALTQKRECCGPLHLIC